MTQEAEVDGGALLRLHIEGVEWADEVPPVPTGRVVTVSLRSPDRMRDRGALEELGYTVVSARPVSASVEATADFLVARMMPPAHPRWWRTLAALAVKSYDLSCGPVQVALADVLKPHLALGGSSRRGRLDTVQ